MLIFAKKNVKGSIAFKFMIYRADKGSVRLIQHEVEISKKLIICFYDHTLNRLQVSIPLVRNYIKKLYLLNLLLHKTNATSKLKRFQFFQNLFKHINCIVFGCAYFVKKLPILHTHYPWPEKPIKTTSTRKMSSFVFTWQCITVCTR